jgi:hypothetical protein
MSPAEKGDQVVREGNTQRGPLWVLCLTQLAVVGCNMEATRIWMEKVTPPEDDRLARDLIAALVSKDYGFIIANMDEQALGETPEVVLGELYAYIDHNEPQTVELVGCHVFREGTQCRSNLTYQLRFPDSWCTAALVIDSDGGMRQAVGFHLQKLPASLAEINRFTLKDKTLSHFVVLLNAIGVPLFIIYALIQCIRTRVRRKWLWILFILVGVGALELNWTTGQIRLQLLSVRLLGAGIIRRGLYTPWFLTIAFPLGAFLFLRKRRRLRATAVSGGGVASAPCESPPLVSEDNLALTCPEADRCDRDTGVNGGE